MSMNRRQFCHAGAAVTVAATFPGQVFGMAPEKWLKIIPVGEGVSVNLRIVADAAGYAGEKFATLKFLITNTVRGIETGDWPEGVSIELFYDAGVAASDFYEDPNMTAFPRAADGGGFIG